MEQICAVCCGTKREIEIDCPSNCAYLRSGRDYEAEKRIPDPELMAKADQFNDEFFLTFAPIIDAVLSAVVAERKESQWLVDNDLIEVLKALTATFKTLSSGIYYESLPDKPIRQALFRRIKSLFDQLMQPSERIDEPSLKVSETLDILDFITLAAQANSSIRPKSRKYLDFLASMARPERAAEPSSSGLILP
jgi:hypothetical protein